MALAWRYVCHRLTSPREAVIDRMFLVGEVQAVIDGLVQAFAKLRSSPAWEEDVEPSIRAWLQD